MVEQETVRAIINTSVAEMEFTVSTIPYCLPYSYMGAVVASTGPVSSDLIFHWKMRDYSVLIVHVQDAFGYSSRR